MAKNLESETRYGLFNSLKWILYLSGVGEWYASLTIRNNKELYVKGVSAINLKHRLY